MLSLGIGTPGLSSLNIMATFSPAAPATSLNRPDAD